MSCVTSCSCTMSSSTEFVVEQKELTDENIKQFRKFTSQSVGQSISVPENNVLFFGYRVSHQGINLLLIKYVPDTNI